MDLAVILAAPRSGSTYLQNLLASHPKIVSPQETHLFFNYLGPLLDEWDRQRVQTDAQLRRILRGEKPDSRFIGLPTILEDEEFGEWVRWPVHRIMSHCLASKPGADLIVEKTPSNALAVAHIARVWPSVKFIHLIRDPEQVIPSQLAAKSWASDWANIGVRAAAHRWNDHVATVSSFTRQHPEVEVVYYDELVRDPAAVHLRLSQFLERPLDTEAAQAADTDATDAVSSGLVSANPVAYAFRPSIERQLGALAHIATLEPSGFAQRSGEARRRLTTRQRWMVDAITEPVRKDVGLDSRPVSGKVAARSFAAYDRLAARVRARIRVALR